jgi:hypothetical protein
MTSAHNLGGTTTVMGRARLSTTQRLFTCFMDKSGDVLHLLVKQAERNGPVTYA